ncbi:MAG: YitT family protein [Aliiglaciecola sp.]|uniref:YitT family protein n=1 Tax=Aliiglaciecola sp. TaxID=1872441 RepID=UPI003297B6D3
MPFPTHRFYEDVLALFSAGIFVSLGVVFFGTQGILTGGSAGIAIIGTHFVPFSFGAVFFVVNIPFYFLAWTKLSKRFTINTFISVTLVSLMTEYMDHFIVISDLDPVFAATVGGMLIGIGMLIMFRHKSSLGGLGILALYLQNKFNLRAGHIGLVADCIILMSSLLMFDFNIVVLSVLGAVTLNILIAVNHIPGRYTATKKVKQKQPEAPAQQELMFDDSIHTSGN